MSTVLRLDGLDGLVPGAAWLVAALALIVALVMAARLRARLALVAEATHELRGPLQAARLGLHGVAAVPGAGARRLAAVELELRRAGLALDDLEAARGGRRRGDRHVAVDVGALLAGAVEGWRPLAGARAAELHFAPPATRFLVRADPLRLAQAAGNLVANALEHGGGPVRVRVQATAAHVRIEVRDQGPGLPAPVAELATRRRHAGRRGHGLAIAGEVAARHGGRLLTAPVAAGACVVLELPRHDALPAAPAVRPRAGRRLRRALR
jgi:signal transduction histidine kinase